MGRSILRSERCRRTGKEISTHNTTSTKETYIHAQYFKYLQILYHIILYNIISYNAISYNIILYRIILYHVIWYHILSYHVILYHIILYLCTSFYTISYLIISYDIITYHILIWYNIIPYHIILSLSLSLSLSPSLSLSVSLSLSLSLSLTPSFSPSFIHRWRWRGCFLCQSMSWHYRRRPWCCARTRRDHGPTGDTRYPAIREVHLYASIIRIRHQHFSLMLAFSWFMFLRTFLCLILISIFFDDYVDKLW